MRPDLLNALVCPRCGGRLTLDVLAVESDGQVWDGRLVCRCGEAVRIVDGIPRFADVAPDDRASSGEGRRQVRDSFSFKWRRFPRFGFERPTVGSFYDEWFCRKLGFAAMGEFESYLAARRSFLDAGTGLGTKVATFCRANPRAPAVGIDLSESVVAAFDNTRRWHNAHIIQGNLMRLPFPEAHFDLIVSDGVLHHTADAKKAFASLVPYLARGGEIAIHVYKRMGPIREFCDDTLRERSVRLSPEECWDFSVPFTKFGETLAKLNVTIDVPESLPDLGIEAGRYDLQRFVYYHLFKCFWNPEFTFEENNLVNFDWYHPAFASRHTEQEVVGWFRDAGLTEIRVPNVNVNGVSVIGRRP